MSSTIDSPPLWEIEFRVFDVVAEQTGIAREKLTRESRLIEDLHIDSLDLVELVLAIEEAFDVTFPDDATRLPFISGSVTVGDLAAIVRHQWGTGHVERKGWLAPKPAPPRRFTTPFTQLGGSLTDSAWREGPLHESMAPSDGGFAQFRRRTDGMRCVLLPGANVEIGSTEEAALPDQRPAHRARLSPFLIDAEPVSTLAYARFLNSTCPPPETLLKWCGVADDDRRGRHFQLRRSWNGWEPRAGAEFQPMILVSWFGANAYTMWANRADWRRWDDASAPSFLPTETQWEYAARGAEWRRFPWGDEPCTAERAQVALHIARREYSALLPLADVTASLGVSPFGMRHMAGNVWHWCRDWYAPDFYSTPEAATADPFNSRQTGIRSERGGSWIGPGVLAASSYRRGRPPHARGRCLGFRCVRSLD